VQTKSCCSPEECWTKVFMQRFNTPTAPAQFHGKSKPASFNQLTK